MTLVQVHKKEHTQELAPHLYSGEFACRCDSERCKYLLIADDLIISWIKLRRDYGKPIHITSGHRCISHNQYVGGLPNSYHTWGGAIDITSPDDMDNLHDKAQRYFATVIRYKDFLHCQVRLT